jgi:hypothetical protein
VRQFREFFLSRIAAILALLLVLTGLIVGTHTHGSVTAAWESIGVSSTSPLFSDLHTVTNSIDAVKAGQDPYVVRTFDPWHRLYNYPSIWLDLRFLGITSRDTVAIGILFALSTTCVYFFLFRTRSVFNTILALLALVSMPALTVIERGNIDEVVFGLLVFGYLLAHRFNKSGWLTGRAILIVLMTMLKIYPIAMVAGLLRRRRGFLIAAVVAVAGVAALLLGSGKSVIHALKNTPISQDFSYGSTTVLWFFVRDCNTFLTRSWLSIHIHSAASAIAIALGLAAIAYGALRPSIVARAVPLADSESVRGAITLACLAVHLFVFVSGTSYYYRLAFLMPPLAYILDEFSGRHIRYARFAAFLLVAFLWSTSLRSPAMTERILDPIVYLGCSLWLGASLFGKQSQQPAPEIQYVSE